MNSHPSGLFKESQLAPDWMRAIHLNLETGLVVTVSPRGRILKCSILGYVIELSQPHGGRLRVICREKKKLD